MNAVRHFSQFVRLIIFAGLAALYFVAGRLALQLAFLNASATPVWPPSGIALSALLIFGRRMWPAVFLGAFLVNVTTAGTVLTSLGVAAGNTLEGVAGAWLVERFCGGRRVFESAANIFRFVLLAGLVSTAISATCGVSVLALGGFVEWPMFWGVWLTWWLGDAVGAAVVTPLILLCGTGPQPVWHPVQMVEAGAIVAGLGLIGVLVFGGLLPDGARAVPLEFLCLPVLIWAAFRFGARETSVGVVILAAIAIWGTVKGNGPFVIDDRNVSLLLLQTFLGVTSVMTLTLAAEVAERRRAERQARELAITDPLTGLANYRRLVDVLEREIDRARRSDRAFAILLFDLDGLKNLNDTRGHLAGNEALVRVAGALRAACRVTDTAARYGGDEFVLVLPDTGRDGAMLLTQRIRQDLAGGDPPAGLSVSAGVASYPEDGTSVDALIGAADRALYHAKRARR